MPYTEIGGIEHYYQIHGTGDPLLLLHGGFCTLETMTAQIEALAATHRVYAPERVGHGRTADRDGSYSVAAMAAETVSWMLSGSPMPMWSDSATARSSVCCSPSTIRSGCGVRSLPEPVGH